ncbi:MAG: uroporphyrinogen-III C-methyltransferase [Pseudomonadales bacterium]|nr:uroporphyrinogen-III C-methyltransferase [Pseudomonadales bacterium]
MNTLQIALKLAGQPCLVVGGGAVARRKIELLVAAKAELKVVAVAPGEEVLDFCGKHGIAVERRPFDALDVAGRLLVIAATDDAEVNAEVFAACRRHGVLVNCVDRGDLSTAIFPAIVDRDPVTVGISTGGASPTLARHLRERIEILLPTSLGALAGYLGSRREQIKVAMPDAADRQKFWDRVLDSLLGDLASRGNLEGADAVLAAELASPGSTGLVSLVGGGPGDPELLTIRALRCLQRADVVYHDKLVSTGVLERCRRDARRVDVGRRAGEGGSRNRQQGINAQLVDDARRGLRVVRLKGGDPLVFSRGGEEIAWLADQDVPFEVVPGVTAASACAAIAGIPLTHRDWAQSVCFVTARAHGRLDLDWTEAAKQDQTLVVYMGLKVLASVCERLVAAGADAETPAAAVSRATLPDQRVVAGSLGDLASRVREANLKGPLTTVVGRVASLAGDTPP